MLPAVVGMTCSTVRLCPPWRPHVYHICISDARQRLQTPPKERHKKNKDKHKTQKEHRRKKEKVRAWRGVGWWV
jgi:hypothetical protein